MNQAIKILKDRIDVLHSKIDEAEQSIDEPEMTCDILFAENDIANWELEVIELQKAVKILNSHIE